MRPDRSFGGDRPRLFVAVPVPSAAADACSAILGRAQAEVPDHRVRWIETERLHLTLRFLGAVDVEAVEGIRRALTRAAGGHRGFEVVLAGAGAFPSPLRPRVLWLGIEAGAVDLAAVSADVDRALLPLGWPVPERPFRPHLTVARADAAPYATGAAAAAALADAAGSSTIAFAATDLRLYRSHLGRGPARYEVVETAAFGAG